MEKNDVMLITSDSNLFFSTGYENADAVLVLTENRSQYFTDSRYFEEVSDISDRFEILPINVDVSMLIPEGAKRIGIEDELSYKKYLRLKHRFPDAEFYSVSEDLILKRAKKTKNEINLMKMAQKATDAAFSEVLPLIKEGMTETELASILEGLLFKNGGDGLSFSSIVAFGKNTSKPHAHRSENKLSCGQLITMDFGAKYRGYCSDMTRTVAFGKVSQEMIAAYNTVLDAQVRVIDDLYSGICGAEADAICRKYFSEKGVDKFFLHSLGHGIGIDIHERPLLSPKSKDKLMDGNVFSIEPGLYFAGNFGIRIEDMVYFDKTNLIDLTTSEKKLIIL